MLRFLALLFFLLHIGAVSALAPDEAHVVRLMPATRSVDLAAQVQVLEDTAGQLSLADVRQRSDFRPVPVSGDAALNFGYSASAWWLRIDLDAAPETPRDWLLEVAFPTLDSVEYFGPGDERLAAGDRQPFSARPLAHRNFVFPVRLHEAGRNTLWLRIVSEGTLTVPLRLWQPEAFRVDSQTGYAVLSMYYGMLLALALYNLLLWFSLRDHTYLTYVLFAVCMAIGQLSLNGLGNEFLWPDWPGWGNLAFPVGFAATGLFGALFTRSFLGTRRNVPGLDAVVSGLAVLFAACMLLPLAAPYRLAAIVTSLTGVSFSLVAVIAGVRCWRLGHPGARVFLIAWTLLLCGVAVVGLRNLNVLPTTLVTFYAMQIGSALEMLLLSFALADRITGLRRDKDLALAEALTAKQDLVDTLQRSEADLARRVAERTGELESANARLRENERQLQAMVHTDPLTGLANRLLLEARLQQSMQHARRTKENIAVLLVDLDRFKPINDRYGHAIGDEVLRLVAERLRNAVREVDTVARLGGDEFVIVLQSLGSVEDAERIAAKIVADLAQPMRVLGLPLEVGACVGIALFANANGELSSAELLRRADEAMYGAKNAGRGSYRVFKA